MSDHPKHITPENQDTFTSNVTEVVEKFLDVIERENICAACFFNYFTYYMTTSILEVAPEKKPEILNGLAFIAGRILNAEVGFVVHRPIEDIEEEMHEVFNITPLKGKTIQ